MQNINISVFAIQDIVLSLGSNNCGRCRMTLVCKHWHMSTTRNIPRECWEAGKTQCLVDLSPANFQSAHKTFSFLKQDLFTFLNINNNIDTNDNQGTSLFWWGLAIQFGDVRLLEFIFHEFKLTPDDARFSENDAVWRSAMSGHLHVLKFLRYKCRLTTEDARSNDNAALRYAARGGFPEILVHLHDDWGLTLEDAQVALDSFIPMYAGNAESHANLVHENSRPGFKKKVLNDNVMQVLYKVFKMPPKTSFAT